MERGQEQLHLLLDQGNSMMAKELKYLQLFPPNQQPPAINDRE